MTSTMTSHEAAFMRRVFDARTERGMSQAKLAELMVTLGHRWSQAAVWSTENGQRRLGFDEAVDLAALLDLSLPGNAEPPTRTQALTEMRQLIAELSAAAGRL